VGGTTDQRQKHGTPGSKRNDPRPSHERPSSFPFILKRPDPKMTFNGKPISSEQQRTLYDDIKNDRCTRCHQKGHLRRNCPDTTPHRWEQRFDSQKANYWVSIAKWHDKTTSSSPTGTAKPKETKGKGSGPPNTDTKYVKQHHRNTLDCGTDSNDDSDPNNESGIDHHQLRFRMNIYEHDSNATSPSPIAFQSARLRTSVPPLIPK
jgi:hypothetical protein